MPFPFPWQPGMRITAGRLTAGFLSGYEEVMMSSTPITTALYATTYYRGTLAVTFPVGAFTEAPRVQAQARSTSPGVLIETSVTSVSATGFTIIVARGSTVTTGVDWVAVAA
ncbi:hypothetical protein ACIQPT_34885 [Streptomyces sp. NPDC091289]|uniref:hypothetical protein n=1 Tax=Streptomyces sp. NPDC091289 TaxID=3365989 RepID=UPI0037F72ED3